MLVGVDGGGTKTEFVLCSPQGQALRRLLRGPCNPNAVGLDRAGSEIASGLEALLPQEQVGARVFAGVAGSLVGDNRDQLAQALRAKFPALSIQVDSDIRNVIASVPHDGGCTAAILGTGCVVFQDDGAGALRRTGGWGWLFDGAGSGFDLGRDAIRERLAFEDGLAPPGPLVEAVGARLGGSAFDSLRRFLSDGNRADVAAFAPLVFDACDAGDPAARAILARTVAHVATLVRHARSAQAAPGPLILGGGLTARADRLVPALREALGPDAPDVIVPTLPPVFGACRLAAESAGDDFTDRFTASYPSLLKNT
ncbi:MAG: N-acetylglucosamine kinase [Kiritimatiellia bacterium]|jgi:N-acetylglucosamine kinase-like BadF-type ATPase